MLTSKHGVTVAIIMFTVTLCLQAIQWSFNRNRASSEWMNWWSSGHQTFDLWGWWKDPYWFSYGTSFDCRTNYLHELGFLTQECDVKNHSVGLAESESYKKSTPTASVLRNPTPQPCKVHSCLSSILICLRQLPSFWRGTWNWKKCIMQTGLNLGGKSTISTASKTQNVLLTEDIGQRIAWVLFLSLCTFSPL